MLAKCVLSIMELNGISATAIRPNWKFVKCSCHPPRGKTCHFTSCATLKCMQIKRCSSMWTMQIWDCYWIACRKSERFFLYISVRNSCFRCRNERRVICFVPYAPYLFLIFYNFTMTNLFSFNCLSTFSQIGGLMHYSKILSKKSFLRIIFDCVSTFPCSNSFV